MSTSTTAPDINDLSLLNEACEGISTSADPGEFFRVPLPSDGDHVAVLALGQDGVSHDTQKTGEAAGRVYVKAHLALKIEDPQDPANGLMLFDRVNSIVFESKGTSRLHGVMYMAGVPLDPRLSKGEIIEKVKVELAQSPRVKVTSQWQASAKAQTQEEADKASTLKYKKNCKVGDYYTFLKGMRNFPSITDDAGVHYSPEVANPLTGEVVTAQAQVVKYAPAQ